MSEYLVTWSIDIDAKSPKQAAKKALEIQRDPKSHATCFEVQNPKTGRRTVVALCLNESYKI